MSAVLHLVCESARSNQTMQRTATRCATTFSMIKTPSLRFSSLPVAVADLILVRPLRRVRLPSFVCIIFALIGTAAGAPEMPLPSDFHITIHDYPGLSDWKAFETTISADGSVHQKVALDRGWQSKRAAISQRAVAQLFDVIQKQRFFSLAADYPTTAEDCATYVVTVQAGGRSHRVTFATCFRSRGTEAEWSRFLRVWAAALRAYPSPNGEQKPEDYDR